MKYETAVLIAGAIMFVTGIVVFLISYRWVGRSRKALLDARDEIIGLKTSNEEWKYNFQIYNKEVIRATKHYKLAHPNFPIKAIPDTGRMIGWLCQRLEELEKQLPKQSPLKPSPNDTHKKKQG